MGISREPGLTPRYRMGSLILFADIRFLGLL
jgi:hypothetical protein